MAECDYCGRNAATTMRTGEVVYGSRLHACPQCMDRWLDEYDARHADADDEARRLESEGK